MTRIAKTISLTPEENKKVDELRSNSKFIFSQWVRAEFRKQFMGVEGKNKKIQEYTEKIEILKKEIKEITQREIEIKNTYTTNEVRWLKDNHYVINNSNLHDYLDLFNSIFKRTFLVDEFNEALRKIGGRNE